MTTASLYYDDSDPACPGWAYCIPGGESGPLTTCAEEIESLIDQREGDIAITLELIASELPAGVDCICICIPGHPDCAPVYVDLHP